MRANRYLLLSVSALVVVFLLAGGLVVRVGAAESSYRQAVLFAEVLSLVMENYVDPVEAQQLLAGAYEGMLGGLDPNGAYLTPDEVVSWKEQPPGEWVGPGVTVLKAGRIAQVVAVEFGSSAAEAGVEIGDQIRNIDGTSTRDLSLAQTRRLLEGPSGSHLTVDLLRPADGFRRLDGIELVRHARSARSYELDVTKGIGVLRPLTLRGLDLDALSAELAALASAGTDRLLLDLRNLADGTPREARGLAALFVGDTTLELRDPSGRLLESVQIEGGKSRWPGSLSVLTNGATADGGEALAMILGENADVTVFGESTYGLGAEARLYELEDGSGLLVSSAMWETAGGETWNGDGVEPDEVVEGKGAVYAEVAADQLSKVIEKVEKSVAAGERKAA
jgi:carboxyl-terminal processing protease